jgi:hypothetical protein
MQLTPYSERSRIYLATSALASVALLGCSGSSVGPVHDAGLHADGAATYSGSSSGSAPGAGPGGGDGSGGASAGDDAGPSGDATGTDGPGGNVEGGAPTGDAGDAATGHATSCHPPEGGLPCDPGVVSCGGASCTTSSQFCCVGGAQGGAGDVCSPFNGASCPSSALAVACDEAADCSGALCCEQEVGLGVAGPTQCMASCPSGWFQACKSHSECNSHGDAGGLNRCVLQTCTQPPGLLGGGSSVTVEACAVPSTLTNLNNGGALAGCVAQ